ncbi:MAG: hypothetical protein KGK07_14395 [Chloroflexota bacterium]|nr:hypothetical protein [Chloroflexota bacterium]
MSEERPSVAGNGPDRGYAVEYVGDCVNVYGGDVADESPNVTTLRATRGGTPLAFALAAIAGLSASERLRLLPSPDDPAAVEYFAERVHEAWMRQKVADGAKDHAWRGAVEPVDVGLMADGSFDLAVRQGSCDVCGAAFSKHHPDMLPYTDLSEPVKEYDRATVRAVLAALADWPPKGAVP